MVREIDLSYEEFKRQLSLQAIDTEDYEQAIRDWCDENDY